MQRAFPGAGVLGFVGLVCVLADQLGDLQTVTIALNVDGLVVGDACIPNYQSKPLR